MSEPSRDGGEATAGAVCGEVDAEASAAGMVVRLRPR